MSRDPRIDLPDFLQHVTVRGLQRGRIFRDDEDREAFRSRLSALLVATQTECLAWALLPNRFHLLLRPRDVPLATFMRRLLTGYAVTFNLRHRRAGHLFHNRYSSVVCEDEPYLRELVRYIHLAPLRAKLVQDLDALNEYPWSGHAVLMGERELAGQAVGEVLGRFARRVRDARRQYREFLAAGVRMGRRIGLEGGGPPRRRRTIRAGAKQKGRDERVLGSPAFLERLRQEGKLPATVPPPMPIGALARLVASHFGVDPGRVRRRAKRPAVSQARAVICCLAVNDLGYRAAEVGKFLGIGPASVSRAIVRGGEALRIHPGLREGVLAAGKEPR